MKCKSCGHVFNHDRQHMTYCPCGKTFQDWLGWGSLYRYGGEFDSTDDGENDQKKYTSV